MSDSNEWATPAEVFAPLHEEFRFTLDACAAQWNAKLPRYRSKADDGLSTDWAGERVWCNPPYSRGEIIKWVTKAIEATWSGGCPLVVLLIPSSTDMDWWHAAWHRRNCEIRFFRGRIAFERESGFRNVHARFGCSLLIFRGHNEVRDV